MNREAARDSGLGRNAYPAYHDFKVLFNEGHYLDKDHINSNLLPSDGAGDLFSDTGREWEYSQYVAPVSGGSASPTENAVHMLGGDSAFPNAYMATDGSNGVIQMYGDTRITVGASEPDLPGDASTSWATDLMDTGTTDPTIIQHLEWINDRPPYGHALDAQTGDNPLYVGGTETGTGGHRIADLFPLSSETIFVPGGQVPCGLLEVNGQANGVLVVTLAPGRYEGVAAMHMKDVQT